MVIFVVKPLSRCTNHVYLGSTRVNIEHSVASHIRTCFQNVNIKIRSYKTKSTAYVKLDKNSLLSFKIILYYTQKKKSFISIRKVTYLSLMEKVHVTILTPY